MTDGLCVDPSCPHAWMEKHMDEATTYDGEAVRPNAVVRRRTGGPTFRVNEIADDDGRALLHVTSTDGTLITTFHADFAVLVRSA